MTSNFSAGFSASGDPTAKDHQKLFAHELPSKKKQHITCCWQCTNLVYTSLSHVATAVDRKSLFGWSNSPWQRDIITSRETSIQVVVSHD